MYDDPSDERRFKTGVDGSHLITPFQCDLCVFRVLYKRNPRRTSGDKENLAVIRRMNLDAIWSREPSTITKNIGYMNTLITTCESSGFEPQLPRLGPFPSDDVQGFAVAFSMLVQSTRPGRHAKSHLQFETIRKQRSTFSNLYGASCESAESGQIVAMGEATKSFITNCPTNSLWFTRWQLGCRTRMGHILKQNQAVSIAVALAMIESFKEDIRAAEPKSWKRQRLCQGLVFLVVCYGASLRGSEGLKVELPTLKQYIHKGKEAKRSVVIRGNNAKIPIIPAHVILPIKGRFKGEKGERCHLLPLINISKTGLPIRGALELLITTRSEMTNCTNPWAFVSEDGSKMTFGEMNEIFLERLEILKDEDKKGELYDLEQYDIREKFSINRSIRRGSSTHAQNQEISVPVIEAQNRWRKNERAKGRRPNFAMIEHYADIEHLIPTLVRYSAML